MPDNIDALKEQLASLHSEVARVSTVASVKAEFTAGFKAIVAAIQATRKELNERIDARLAQVRDGRDGARGPKGDRGERGPQGKSFIAMRGEQGPPGEAGPAGSPDTGEQIVDKINALPTDDDADKIDASHIKNLPAAPGGNYQSVGMHGALWSLQDVDIAGILAGQSIQWDGIKWIAYTVPGSGGTPAWGENLTAQGPGTVYTLAHTPIAGSVRVFRGGAYQQAGAGGDYTLSGSTITFGTATQQGEVILADYSYA